MPRAAPSSSASRRPASSTAAVGKASFSEEAIAANVKALVDRDQSRQAVGCQGHLHQEGVDQFDHGSGRQARPGHRSQHLSAGQASFRVSSWASVRGEGRRNRKVSNSTCPRPPVPCCFLGAGPKVSAADAAQRRRVKTDFTAVHAEEGSNSGTRPGDASSRGVPERTGPNADRSDGRLAGADDRQVQPGVFRKRGPDQREQTWIARKRQELVGTLNEVFKDLWRRRGRPLFRPHRPAQMHGPPSQGEGGQVRSL